MMPHYRSRIFRAAALVFLMSTVALIKLPAETWKQVIVNCSPEDLDRIHASVASAVVDAIPGYFLLNVSSSTDISDIARVQGKGPIQAAENSPVHIHPRPHLQPGSTASTPLPSLGGAVDWFGTPARSGYTNQAAVGKISLNQALHISTGFGVKVAVIDTGIDEQHPALRPVISGGKNYAGRTML